MKYQRPENLAAPYPEDCELCGTALTFASVMELVIVDGPGEGEINLDFSEASAFCKRCGKELIEEAMAEAKDAGLEVGHIELTSQAFEKKKREKLH